MPREKTMVISLRLTPGLKEAVEKAADRSGLGQMDWIRAVLARAANEGAFAPRPKKRERKKRD